MGGIKAERELKAYRATGMTPEECAEMARQRAALERIFGVPFVVLAQAAADYEVMKGGDGDAQGSEGLHRRGGKGGG